MNHYKADPLDDSNTRHSHEDTLQTITSLSSSSPICLRDKMTMFCFGYGTLFLLFTQIHLTALLWTCLHYGQQTNHLIQCKGKKKS